MAGSPTRRNWKPSAPALSGASSGAPGREAARGIAARPTRRMSPAMRSTGSPMTGGSDAAMTAPTAAMEVPSARS